MKRVFILIATILVLLSSASCSDAPDWGESAQYESYKAYVAQNVLLDSFLSSGVETETASPILPVYGTVDNSANVPAQKNITFLGEAYTAYYDESGYSEYNTLIDKYVSYNDRNTVDKIFEYGKNGQVLTSIQFISSYKSGLDVYRHTQGEEFYINIAKSAVEPLLDISDYTVRCEIPETSAYRPCHVYFEKHIDGYLLTSAYVAILSDGTVLNIHTENDYDWNSISINTVDATAVNSELDSKMSAVHTTKQLEYKGYETRYQRIAPDINGRLALHTHVWSIHDTNVKFINPLVIVVYLE